MLCHLGYYFEGLGTSKGWKVHEAACAENTKKSVLTSYVGYFFTPRQTKA